MRRVGREGGGKGGIGFREGFVDRGVSRVSRTALLVGNFLAGRLHVSRHGGPDLVS